MLGKVAWHRPIKFTHNFTSFLVLRNVFVRLILNFLALTLCHLITYIRMRFNDRQNCFSRILQRFSLTVLIFNASISRTILLESLPTCSLIKSVFSVNRTNKSMCFCSVVFFLSNTNNKQCIICWKLIWKFIATVGYRKMKSCTGFIYISWMNAKRNFLKFIL